MAKIKKMYVVMMFDKENDHYYEFGAYKTFEEAKEQAGIKDYIYEVHAKWNIEQAVKVVTGDLDNEFE